MQHNKLFDLANRVPLAKSMLSNVEDCRSFDRDIRVSMIVPMNKVISLLSPYISHGAKVVDVGCGSGLLSLRLAGKNPQAEIFGVEENDKLLLVAEENITLAGLINAPGRVEFQYADMEKIPIKDQVADVVFSFFSLHNWKNPIKTLQECYRICKPSGLVFIYDLARDTEEGVISFIIQYINSGVDKFMEALRASYTKSEIKNMLQACNLSDWDIVSEAVNLCIMSHKIM